jgi:hypothetical protein
MVPNSVVLNVAITPLREPDAVSLRARLRPGTTPRDLQATIQEAVSVPIRDEPRITLEELDGDEVVVQISATPQLASDGPQLATEVLKAVTRQTSNGVGGSPEADSPDADSPDEGSREPE